MPLRAEVTRGGEKNKLRVTIYGPGPWAKRERIVHVTGKVNATARDEQNARNALGRLGIPVAE